MIINETAFLEKLNKTAVDEKVFKVLRAKSGAYTVLTEGGKAGIYLHSKYDPVKSGEQFAKSVYADKDIIIYGLGLGYHIKPLADMLTGDNKLYVLECSLQIAKIAFEKTGIASVLKRENVIFFCSDSLRETAVYIDKVLNDRELTIYEPSLNTIPAHMESLKDVLFEYKSAVYMSLHFKRLMEDNSITNLEAGYRNGVKLFKNSFNKMPAIVVAAGASLDLNVSELVEAQSKALIVSVTRAANTLHKASVVPDFYVASDAGRWLRKHLNFNEMSSPLFLLSTADSDVEDYIGEKLIIFEKNSVPKGEEEYFVETGGSVATTAISLCTVMGADPIIFIGQDLCYSLEKTHSGASAGKVLEMKGGKYVKANDGNEYYTKGSLYIFLKWIERFIERNSGTTFLNATAQGAVIKGAKNINLTDYLAQYKNIRDKINSVKELRL